MSFLGTDFFGKHVVDLRTAKMIGDYARFLFAVASLCAASGYGVFQWKASDLRIALYFNQRQVEAKAGGVAATRAQLKAMEERIVRLRSLNEEIGPAVVSDIVYLAEDKGVAALRVLVAKHQLVQKPAGRLGP